MRAPLCLLGNALILAGCASPYVQVSHVHPRLTGAAGVGSLAAAEQAMKRQCTKNTQRRSLRSLRTFPRSSQTDERGNLAVEDKTFGWRLLQRTEQLRSGCSE
jgi:hypothetical protein